MAKSATLKLAPDPTEPARAELAETLARIEELKASLVLNQRDIDQARADIDATIKQIDEARDELAKTPALQKRPIRERISDLESHLQELKEHLQELHAKRGHYPGCLQPLATSLEVQLDFAQQNARRCTGHILQAHPAVLKLNERFRSGSRRGSRPGSDH
jgi:chromosome segregation ATPase